MTISIGRDAADEEVKVPHVWFFPKTRMRRAIRQAGYEVDDISSNTKKVILTIVYKNRSQVGAYRGNAYYPSFETRDETLKQVVAPYSNIKRIGKYVV